MRQTLTLTAAVLLTLACCAHADDAPIIIKPGPFDMAAGDNIRLMAFALYGALSSGADTNRTEAPWPEPLGKSGSQPWKLLFSDDQDVRNAWGKVQFGGTSLQKLGDCTDPGFTIACCVPNKDGSWSVYGQKFTRTPARNRDYWEIIRAVTRDGSHFERIESVYKSDLDAWTTHFAMAYSPERGEFLLLKMRWDSEGNGYNAFLSSDGLHWREHTQKQLFYDGDAMSVFWCPNANRFVCVTKSFQPVSKHITDHGRISTNSLGEVLSDRRVLTIRTSPDGCDWHPSDKIVNQWKTAGRKTPTAEESAYVKTPDAEDPPDLEFYSGNGFTYHDRVYLMVLNYVASPELPGRHGPHLDNEWWFGRDGIHWTRPCRELNALGNAFPQLARVETSPMLIGGQVIFHCGNQLLGVQEDRISFVGARANAEFSTRSFRMPDADLFLNAASPSPERPFAKVQAYINVAVLDQNDRVVPGFEAEKCFFKTVDNTDLPLRWEQRSARELAGRTISLRFMLGGANIYAVKAQN